MSESYAVLPVTDEVRAWLASVGCARPRIDGKTLSLLQLKQVISSLDGVSSIWGSGRIQDGHLRSSSGSETTVIVGKPGTGSEPCEFHFRGGEPELIELVVREIARHAGPQVIYAHSGTFIKVIGETGAGA